MMLPRLRRFRFLLLCCASALGWVTAGTLDMLGAVDIGDDMVVIAGAGLITVVLLGHVGAQMNSHQFRHYRTDRQLGTVVDVVRYTFECDGDRAPALLEDERELGPGVVRLRPRGAPRHSRARSRRGNA